jgi:hypothetical protein
VLEVLRSDDANKGATPSNRKPGGSDGEQSSDEDEAPTGAPGANVFVAAPPAATTNAAPLRSTYAAQTALDPAFALALHNQGGGAALAAPPTRRSLTFTSAGAPPHTLTLSRLTRQAHAFFVYDSLVPGCYILVQVNPANGEVGFNAVENLDVNARTAPPSPRRA